MAMGFHLIIYDLTFFFLLLLFLLLDMLGVGLIYYSIINPCKLLICVIVRYKFISGYSGFEVLYIIEMHFIISWVYIEVLSSIVRANCIKGGLIKFVV